MTRARHPFTGRHMAAIMIGFFAVVIAVNLLMARMASSTFGGIVVENSYVASQHFNRWLDEAEAEQALGWKAAATRDGDGHLRAVLSGVPGDVAVLTATARHPLGQSPDVALTFARQADGSFRSNQALPAGRWRLRLEIRAQGKLRRSEGDIR